MAATELDEVQALLERVLPDPTGYAQRLLLQAVARWGQAATPGAGASPPAPPGDAGAGGIVIASPYGDAGPIDTNLLLAAALGACECWGLNADCSVCQGRGCTGWTEPDPELFGEFVQPAVDRFRGGQPGAGGQQGGNASDGDHDRTAQGEDR